MQNFITYLVKNLVEEPDQVVVSIHEGTKTYIIEIRVAEADVAKVIGRKGRTIQSLRTIAASLGAKFKLQVKLDLIQDEARAKEKENLHAGQA